MRKGKIKNDFDIQFLDKLVHDKNSCVSIQNCNHHLALHPYHLNDLTQSIKDILSMGISKYDQKLDGILFGYKNIKLLSQLGTVVDDACFIHIDINADFFIFKPQIGSTLTGIVNKKSKDHVGCLVHKIFNVSIPKLDSKNIFWLGQEAVLGSKIQLEITYTDFESRLPYIRGQITSILSQPTSTVSQATKIKFSDNEDEADVDDLSLNQNQVVNDLCDNKLVKMKKTKKSKQDFSEIEIEPVKKKTKKTKKIKKEVEETDSETPLKIKKELLDDDSENRKKRKLLFDEKQESEEVESLPKKKKRKLIENDALPKKPKNTKKIKTENKDDDDVSLPDLDLSRLFDSHAVDLDADAQLERSFSRKRIKSEIELPLINI